MKLFVTGATGVLGTRLVAELADRGHVVHGLARDDGGAELVEARGGTARRGDVLDPATLAEAVDDDVDALVHAATRIPTATKPSAEDWAENDRVRLDGLRNLLDAAPDVEQVLFPGVVMVARQPDGSRFDEGSERHPDRATGSAAEAEDLLREHSDAGAFDAAILRCGLFYAHDAADTRTWAKRLLDGDMPVVGGGLLGRRDAELSLVHPDDAARAFAAAVDAGADGVYHVVDDEPVTAADLFGRFADLLDAPDPGRVPGWLARFFVGTVGANALVTPTVTDNAKARRELDWTPEVPTYHEGLRQVVERWAADGTLRETAGAYEWADE